MLSLVTLFVVCIGLTSVNGWWNRFDCDVVASSEFNGRSEIDYVTVSSGVVMEVQIFNRWRLGRKRSKTPLFFVHGGFQSRQTWGGTLQCLNVRDRAVIVPSLRGHGDSQVYPTGTTFNVADYVPDLIEVLDYYEVESAIWIAHSLGSFIAQTASSVNNGLSISTASYVEEVVLVGTLPVVDPNLCLQVEGFFSLFGDCPGRAALEAFSQISGSLGRANDTRLSNQYFRETTKSEQFLPQAILGGTCSYDGTGVGGILEGIYQKVTIMFGTLDYIGTVAEQQVLVDALVNAASVDYIQFENIGHEIFWEDVQGFSDALEDALFG